MTNGYQYETVFVKYVRTRICANYLSFILIIIYFGTIRT